MAALPVCVFCGFPASSVLFSQSLLIPPICFRAHYIERRGTRRRSDQSHDLEKVNVVVDESASHEHIAYEESSSSASVDGEKQVQSSAESVDTIEASQLYLVSS